MRRKLVILAREAGLTIEQEDVDIKNFLPEACLNAKTVEEFFVELKNSDPIFDKMLAGTVDEGNPDAVGKGGQLRMIAKIEDGKATIALQTVDASNPFCHLDGSDNMVVFTTERYRERPLVVRGPGAGAEVTAAGIFSEIIAIGNYLG